MKKIFEKFISQNFKAKNTGGQEKGKGKFDKFFGITRRSWGLAARLEHIRNRGKQNKK